MSESYFLLSNDIVTALTSGAASGDQSRLQHLAVQKIDQVV